MTYKICRLMDDAEDDVLAHMAFPRERQSTIYSTNPLERLNGEGRLRSETCRTGVRSVVELTGSTWPRAVVKVGAPNGRNRMHSCRSSQKPGSGTRAAASDIHSQLANGRLHFFANDGNGSIV